MCRVAYLVCFISVITLSESARILAVVPTPSISHQVVFRPIVQELVKRGHEVTIITTDPVFQKGDAPANLTEIDMHDFSYKKWNEFHATTSTENNDLFTQIRVAFKLINEVFIEQMQTDEVQKVINDESKPFDLLLLEAIARPALALTHKLKAPAILMSSFGATMFNAEAVGVPIQPMLYPQFLRDRIYNLTFWEKLSEFYKFYKLMRFFYSSEVLENERNKQVFGPDTPDLSELSNNVNMLFLNVNPIWEGNTPVPPNVVYMGGLHQWPRKELPKDLQNFLNSSTNGVIYMSFGTNVSPSQLPRHIIQTFTNVFSKLPYNVLWKWDQDELPGKPDNVRVSKWLPQSDLLRHPNVKLFITQAGLQSTDEAITAEVPLIGIPMLGDQWYNSEKYVHHGIGLKFELNTLSEEQLHNGINMIMTDKSYRENIQRLHRLMRDQPTKPLERVIWWIEHVLRHGGAKHLRSPGANISWAQYLELEFVATLLLLILAVTSFISVILYYLVKFLRSYLVDIKPKTS